MAMRPAQIHFRRKHVARCAFVRLLSIIFFTFVHCANAAVQFDVLIGYDGIVPQASFFPVVCEVRNDGPLFNAFFEISSGQFNQNQIRRVPIELPTNTRKRVVVPMFAGSRYASWNFRLIDDDRNIRAEKLNVRPQKQVAWEFPMFGAMSRSVSGTPVFPSIKPRQTDLQPKPARLKREHFPDNPIALEGLDAIYLNSESALGLKVAQRDALHAWLNGGGHLIVSVEQINDITANGWLAELLPCELVSARTIQPGPEFQKWLQKDAIKLLESTSATNRPSTGQKKWQKEKETLSANPFSELVPDENFAQTDMLVFTGRQRDGIVHVSAQEIPLIVEAQRGRGRITLINFSVEREPFLSWKHREWFWSKTADIPVGLYQSSDYNSYGGVSIDSVFGAMLDSEQVRKIPLEWLLMLLIVYLLVIGPLDQLWLKKINRQMLTWVTFPAYVLLFSALIYFIGFQLRAGDSEFNELQIVDVFPRGEKSVLRGRTYASIYSPSNQRYPLASDQPFATLRGEFTYSYDGGEDSGRANLIQRGNNFVAEISVPVWTSQLYVSDWLQSLDTPVVISSARQGNDWQVSIENKLERKLSDAHVVLDGLVYLIGDLPAHQTKKILLEKNQGMELKNFAKQNGATFFDAAESHLYTFGNKKIKFNLPLATMACSFHSQINDSPGNQFFISPDGFDLSKLSGKGNAILLAWSSDHLLTKPLNKFEPRRKRQNTLLRLVVPNETTF